MDQEASGARQFWERSDVDGVLDRVCGYLETLRGRLKGQTATHTDYVQGLRLVRLVEAADSSSIHDVINTGVLPTPVSSPEEEELPSAPLSPLLVPSNVRLHPLAPPPAGQEWQEEVPANQEEISAGLKEQEEVPADQQEILVGLEEEEEGFSEQEEEMEQEEVLSAEQEEEQTSDEQEEEVYSPQIEEEEEEQVSAPQEEEEEEEVSAPQEEEVSAPQVLYQPHQCTKACVPSLPRSSQPFWGQNPLRVPLLCGFRRVGGQEVPSEDLAYITPCGLCLRSHDDVMHFLFATESYDVLQVEFFTFNAAVRLDPPLAAGPRLPELDLSRGLEPAPVELCPGVAGARPREFRYRKDRWPHGCFLSVPALFHTCCDCEDGCEDADRCACRGRSAGAGGYAHHSLPRPLEAGLLECGPWCGCERARCQNRLAQRGVRVRLQVFQGSAHGGWGVRCRDDLDQGTFICTYAGLVLRKGRDPEEAPPPGRLGAELPSDDDVEVVTEWLVPPLTDGAPPTSAPLHVPVIQRPSEPPPLTPPIAPPPDTSHSPPLTPPIALQESLQTQSIQTQTLQTQDTQTLQTQSLETQTLQTQDTQTLQTQTNQDPDSPIGASQSAVWEEPVAVATVEHRVRAPTVRKRKREEDEDVYYLDATKEGNVARFLNHSCRPNLFTQSVFTDTQDPAFPLVAFFTSRVIKAGTELTWKCSPDTGSASPGQEVACQCGHEDCEGVANGNQAVCEVCDAHEAVCGPEA